MMRHIIRILHPDLHAYLSLNYDCNIDVNGQKSAHALTKGHREAAGLSWHCDDCDIDLTARKSSHIQTKAHMEATGLS